MAGKEKWVPLESRIPGTSLTGDNGVQPIEIPTGHIIRELLLEVKATITVTTAGTPEISEAMLAGAISQVTLMWGDRQIHGPAMNGWLLDCISRQEQGIIPRKNAPPLTAVALDCYWEVPIIFAPRELDDEQAYAFCMPTIEHGGQLRIQTGPWERIYTAGNDPTTWTVSSPEVIAYMKEIKEPRLTKRNIYTQMVPPQWFTYVDNYASIGTQVHRLPIQPGQWLDRVHLIHHKDTAAARFAEYQRIRLLVGSTGLDDIWWNPLFADQTHLIPIPNAEQHEGCISLIKNRANRGMGLPSVGFKEASIEIGQTAADTRNRAAIWKLQDDRALKAGERLRLGGMKGLLATPGGR